jgi:hypothetical protein
MKPRVFIGSSSESLATAYAVQELLPDMEVTVWTQGIFRLSSSILDDLIEVLDNTDFGVFVFTPNDLITIREQQFQAVRDNVVFELGLFVGRLGKNRSFFIVPKDRQDIRLPSDLLGVTPAEYDSNRQDGNLLAALGPACNRIRAATQDFIPAELEEKLTDRLVYLLLHMRERKYALIECYAEVLAHFHTRGARPDKPFLELSQTEKVGWVKAAEYACRYLNELNLVNVVNRSELFVGITPFGRAVLLSPIISHLFYDSFRLPLVEIIDPF